ncbi:hypothetical protein BJ322DRAFT_1024319 [Thelephora terrestris]|uniref:Uncharacterized protein n=1 Tax=Thelephora terrestris TaxID=56493 RepID=A0A9P6H7R3_9AGAM|nr:hypothetical protein BJ322DRAFT_1024319 [Thelephora terrestris]
MCCVGPDWGVGRWHLSNPSYLHGTAWEESGGLPLIYRMATVPTCLRGELIQSEAGTPVKFQTATWKQPQALAPVVEKRVTFRSSHFSLLLPPPPILPPRCCPTPSNHNPSSIMVKRRKNTARKSVGGLAKRIELVPVPDRLLRSRSASSRGSRSSSVASAVPTPPPMEIEGGDQGDVMQVEENLDKPEAGDPFTDDWCALCSDGHDTLVTCNNCGAANCGTCVPGLIEVTNQVLSTCYYKCVGCTHRGALFEGLFYKSSGKPVFPLGMEVATHNLTSTYKNRLRTPRLVIIEFILESLVDTGTAGSMLFMSLVSNYTREHKGNIHHEKILFDLNNDEAQKQHEASMVKRVQRLRKMNTFDHVVVIVHTHSDDERGDLFITSKSDEYQTPLSATIEYVIVGKAVRDYVAGMKYSSLFMLSCGSVVRVEEARNELKKVAQDFLIVDTFAFGAKKVISQFIAIWMISYANKVIVMGMIHPWNRLPETAAHIGDPVELRCKLLDGPWLYKCNESYQIAARPPSTPVEAPYVGTWYACTSDGDEQSS